MKKNRVNFLLAIVLSIAFIVVSLNSHEFIIKNQEQYIQFCIITLFCIINISLLNKYPFSLDSIHWIFIYFFFSIAPIIQCSQNNLPWGLSYDPSSVSYANLIIILWAIVYSIAYSITKNIKIGVKKDSWCRIRKNSVILISIVAAIILFYTIGLSNMFSRVISGDNLNDTFDKSSILILNTFIRAIPVGVFSIIYTNYLKNKDKSKGKWKIYILLSLIIAIITNFPAGVARFWVAVVYIGILILVFNKYFSKSKRIDTLIIIGIVILFPILNIFRYVQFSKVNVGSLMANINLNMFTSADFDAYSMLIRTTSVAKDYGISCGRQLLGAVLFFIPRSVWTNKPLGTGEIVASYQMLKFTNLSNPIQSEGYYNFGVLGVVLFALLFGCLISYVDKLYWFAVEQYKNKVYFIEALYPFLLGNVFAICRGELLTTFAYFAGFTASVYFVYFISNKMIKRNVI